MTMPYLKHIPITIPHGYTVGRRAMTASSERIYFAAAHPTQSKMLVYDQNGADIEAERFNIIQLPAGRSYDALAIDDVNLYLFSNTPALGITANVYTYSKRGVAGQAFDLEGIGDDVQSPYQRVQGALILNDEIVVVLRRRVGAVRLAIARFKPNGEYIANSFLVLTTPPDFIGTPIGGAALADNRVFLLASQLYGYDRGFAYIASESVALHPQNTDALTLGWNGSSVLVYDRAGEMFFYGAEQPTTPVSPTLAPAQYTGLRDSEEQFDIVKIEADSTLTPRAINVPGLKQTTTAEVGAEDSIDLTLSDDRFTIVLRHPIFEIEIDDYIYLNAGVTPENPPTGLPAGERLQVKAWSAAGMLKQILYCVRSPQRTPFAAYERPVSAG